MQAYPGRDPLSEVLSGKITLRKFRVMVERLPPDSALERARTGENGVLWNIEARLRESNKLLYDSNRGPNTPAMDVSYLPLVLSPEQVERAEAQEAYEEAQQAELEALW